MAEPMLESDYRTSSKPSCEPTSFNSKCDPSCVRQSPTESMDPHSGVEQVPPVGEARKGDEADFLSEVCEKLAPAEDEGHKAVLEASEAMQILTKTVSNDDWIEFLRRLQSPRSRTATSLPPPGARCMRFFGNKDKDTTNCVGLMWFRQELDLSEAFIWPPGYFAKSEFNVNADGSLLNGRREALVTLEDLLQRNLDNVGTGNVLPFNEVLTHVHGVKGICGLFARSTQVQHLVWAMGMRALVLRTLPGVGPLPIFIHDVERGLFPLSRAAQRRVVEEFLLHRPALDRVEMPLLPVDTHELELDEQQQLEFHGAYGITREALRECVDSLIGCGAGGSSNDSEDGSLSQSDGEDGVPSQSEECSPCHDERAAPLPPASIEAAYDILLFGLREAVDSNNTSAALSLLRAVMPKLFLSEVQRSSHEQYSAELAACLQTLEAKASSKSMLVAVGAAVALNEFATGRMLPRIVESCKELEAWFDQSSSVYFRMQSWRELKNRVLTRCGTEGPAVSAFVTQRAVENRTSFYQGLLDLVAHLRAENCQDMLHGMKTLHSLVAQLRTPCLRLIMLQDILDLDGRFDVATMASAARIADQVVSEPEEESKFVLPPKTLAAPLFQLETAGCLMQGVDVTDTVEIGV